MFCFSYIQNFTLTFTNSSFIYFFQGARFLLRFASTPVCSSRIRRRFRPLFLLILVLILLIHFDLVPPSSRRDCGNAVSRDRLPSSVSSVSSSPKRQATSEPADPQPAKPGSVASQLVCAATIEKVRQMMTCASLHLPVRHHHVVASLKKRHAKLSFLFCVFTKFVFIKKKVLIFFIIVNLLNLN